MLSKMFTHKTFLMKKIKFSKLALLLILALSTLSCKMALLGPSNIPPPTDFYIPPDTIPGEVDIEPIPAPDGMVFGGFEKRFIYQGKWHVLIKNTYNYDPKTKTLSKSATNSIIRLEDENNILIVAQNLHPNDSDSPYALLKRNDIVIEKNKIWRNYNKSIGNNQFQAASRSSKGKVWHPSWGRFKTIAYYDKVESFYEYRYTENLQKVSISGSHNPSMPSPPYVETLMTFPKPSEFGGESDSWQRKYGINDKSKAIFFKDHYYVFGGTRDWLEDNPSGTRPGSAGSYSTTETTYKRIHKNNNGRINGNWEIITPPWGSRAGGYIPDTRNIKTTEAINKKSFSDDIAVGEAPNNYNVNYMKNEKSSDGWLQIRLSRDGKTLFIGYGHEEGNHIHDGGWSPYAIKKYNDIWSTTDGVNWKLDTKANFDDAYYYNTSYYDYVFNYYDDERHKYVAKAKPTPLEPDWAKSTKNAYYKMDNIYSYIPTPYEEIVDAAERGETNFVLTDEHKNAYNNFLISSVHPDTAEQSNWKALRIHNYTKSSMHWISSPKYLFSFGDKLIRFVDYDAISSYYDGHTSRKRYNELIKEHKLWHKRGEAGGYTTDWREYSQIECYQQSMYYKAQADLMSEVLHGDIKDAYPDDAIRHYVLEFRH